MPSSSKLPILMFATLAVAAVLLFNSQFASHAQTLLTYPELNTALQTKLPNRSFKNKAELIKWIILQVRTRKLDKPLTKDREDDLRQAGATEELIQAIKTNSPAPATPTPLPRTVVDLGDLATRAVNLVKPEYTAEARHAGITGEVKLALELDEQGRVSSITRLAVLPSGLTENAIEAARQSTFRPARLDGRPARGSGILIYNFKMNVIDIPEVLANAEDLRGQGQYERAAVEYSRVVEADSKNARAFFGRGMCNLTTGHYEAAAADLYAASLADASDAETFFYLAIADDFRGEPTKAATFYGKALSLLPEYGRRPIAECLYIDRSQMSPDQARAAASGIINACTQSLRGAPDYMASLIYVKRGIGYRMKGDFDRAIAEFEAARRTNPQFSGVQMQLHTTYNSRGLAAFDKKDYKAAFEDISAAIDLKPDSPTPYINRCVIYLYAWKQFDNAITDCSRAIKLSTKSSMAYVHRGYAYELKNDTNSAIADYRKALDIDPRNQAAQNNLYRLDKPSIKKY